MTFVNLPSAHLKPRSAGRNAMLLLVRCWNTMYKIQNNYLSRLAVSKLTLSMVTMNLNIPHMYQTHQWKKSEDDPQQIHCISTIPSFPFLGRFFDSLGLFSEPLTSKRQSKSQNLQSFHLPSNFFWGDSYSPQTKTHNTPESNILNFQMLGESFHTTIDRTWRWLSASSFAIHTDNAIPSNTCEAAVPSPLVQNKVSYTSFWASKKCVLNCN